MRHSSYLIDDFISGKKKNGRVRSGKESLCHYHFLACLLALQNAEETCPSGKIKDRN